MTKIIKLEELNSYEEVVKEAANILKNDGVLLVPTDTVYGLVCLSTSDNGVRKIFKMKQRPVQKKIPVIVSNIEQLKKLPIIWNKYIDKLASKYWPGALTLAIGIKKNKVEWLKEREEIAVRIPNNKFIIDLANNVGPLLMTSANKSGEEIPHTIEGALESLEGSPEMVIDGGKLSGLPSTLVNVNNMYPKVEREGIIKVEEIIKVIENE